ncbi:MAG: amino acid ABC transporter substrate-binding protein [Desulfobacteraceae bacterium]|nr:amino acid ABC transporter substrate-binding protein [Desulfobacteraceae bacterium]
MKNFIIFLFLCLVPLNAFADCELKVRVTDYAPQYYQDNGKWKGLAVELVEVLLNEANCKPIYLIVPWKRALDHMRIGKIDIMLNLSITDERKEFINFIGPQRDESMILVVSEDTNFEIRSLEDIKKISGLIGIQRGAYYGESFKVKYTAEETFAQKFYEVTYAKQFVKMYNAKRLSGFFIDRYEFFYKLNTNEEFKGLKASKFIINQDFVYFGLSKESVSNELLDRIQQAYEKAKAKGKFERVLERYR